MPAPDPFRPTLVDRIAVGIVAGTVLGCVACLFVDPLPGEIEWQRLIVAPAFAASSQVPMQIADASPCARRANTTSSRVTASPAASAKASRN